MIQTWQPTRATGRCRIASWSKWLLRLSFIPWIHTLSEPRRLKSDLNPRLSFNLIKTMPTQRWPWSYRCRLRAKAPASGFHSISCTCNSEQIFLRLSWYFNWSLLSDTHILNLGWRIGILLFFTLQVRNYSHSTSNLINLSHFLNWFRSLINICNVNHKKTHICEQT